MNPSNPPRTSLSDLVKAETYTPRSLQAVILGIENAAHSHEVWKLIVALGQSVGLPYIDFIASSSFKDWRKTLFIRTSYDSTWLNKMNTDPEVSRWSYFRSHALHYQTPVMVGLEFAEEYRHLPEKRINVLRTAAEKGMRAGISFPLRSFAPAQSAMITFMGNHTREAMIDIVKTHGWTLHSGALMAHQRYVQLFTAEFTERNQITPKQLQLVQMIGLGYQDKVISEKLGVSVSAVRQRMNALLANTGLQTRSELAALAMSLGLLPDPFNRPAAPSETIVEMDVGGPPSRLPNPFNK